MTTIRERINHARQQELLTVEQAALLAQYHPQTIYRKAARGELRGVVRYGRGLRLRRAAFLEGLADRLAELQSAAAV